MVAADTGFEASRAPMIFEVLVDLCPEPVALQIRAGEIVGLLFPGRRPVYLGEVRVQGPGSECKTARIAMTGETSFAVVSALAWALATRPSVAIVDGLFEFPDRGAERAWGLLRAACEQGVAVVVATAAVEQARRFDRVLLVSWNVTQLREASGHLKVAMHARVARLLELLPDENRPRVRSVAMELRALNVAARALLAELRRVGRTQEDVLLTHQLAAELATESVSDRVLDALIGPSENR
jgi:hypothetical protein